MPQIVLYASDDYKELDDYLQENGTHKILLVCDRSFSYLKLGSYFEKLKERPGIKVEVFSDFQPNPVYESVVKGVQVFRKSGCEQIIAIGGGSAIDVAKCIKLYSGMEGDGAGGAYLWQTEVKNNINFLAIPTTAGTGSEATRYAVIYYNGEKQSVTSDSVIPDVVLMDCSTLDTLPMYQKKSTMLDALCHGVESFWSVNSTEQSRMYSRKAIRMIIDHLEGYLHNCKKANAAMQTAAYIAGKAINIAQTTAGHAMCYKLTSLYGIAHGHAAALCVKSLWPWMIGHMDLCVDSRGKKYLAGMFGCLADIFGATDAMGAVKKFLQIYDSLALATPDAAKDDYNVLKSSVNPLRLKNNPVALDEDSINFLYYSILAEDNGK